MLGHKVFHTLSRAFDDTWCGLRRWNASTWRPLHEKPRNLLQLEADDFTSVETELRKHEFELVVNCVGVVKQRAEAMEAIPTITINSLLPHRIAACLEEWGGRLIHFSTDCVFSGRRGDYSETDSSDAEDLYGKTKFLGEVRTENALTLRTSIIGRELTNHRSLLDWFLAQNGKTVRGFTRSWWSGVTTNHLADFVAHIVDRKVNLHGLYQVSSAKISKYELLRKLRDAYGLDIELIPDDAFYCDRSLRGDRLREAIGYECPTWDAMIAQLVSDPTDYPLPVVGHGTTGR